MRARAGISLFTIALALTAGAAAADDRAPKKLVTSIGPTAAGEEGMVVTTNSDAGRVGAEVLAGGGNAVDAAVAMMFALGVSEPGHSGIGGGGFMLVYEAKTGEITVIDSRERAPASAKPTMFLKKNGEPIAFKKRRTLGVAVGVPGALAGAEAALERFGSRSLASLLEPSIALAEHGVIVTPLLADSIVEHEDVLAANPAARALFMPGGRALAAGELLVQPELAETMRLLAKQGIDAFYRGEIGQAFVAEVQAAGGGMKLADLKKYEVTLDEPVRGEYLDHEVVTVGPPSLGGLTLLQMLELLEALELEQQPAGSSAWHHLVMKATQLAFADRIAYLGDPEFVEAPLAGWLDRDYVKERAELVALDENTCPLAPGDVPRGQGAPLELEPEGPPQTTHVNVADRWGNLVSFTTTIEQHFGTGRLLPGYGFFLNNELTDFDPRPGGPNSPAPGKRPGSSMAPTLVLRDGAPWLVLGSPGGPRIISAVAQVLLDVIAEGLDPEVAVALPRVHSVDCAQKIRWDGPLSPTVRDELEALGHRFRAEPLEVGDVGVIELVGDAYVGVADPRRDGVAVGLSRAE